MEYETLRKRMVEEQLIRRGIKDKKTLFAFYKVERHKFVPEEVRKNAYGDYPLPIGEGQTISQPYIVALMTQTLDLTGSEKILEIGTGSGYQTAILAELGGKIYSVERIEILAKRAESVLTELGYNNIRITKGNGTLGWPEESPFDRIIVTAATAQIPVPLTEQLKENGKIVLPLGDRFSQTLTLAEKKNNKLYSEPICGCIFVPLIGKYSYA